VGVVTALGALIVLIECLWISYGVFARYMLRRPDAMVTEATALLLLPLAYLGLPKALKDDAFPKVTLLIDRLPPIIKNFVERVNLLLMVLTGACLSVVAGAAAVRTYGTGAASQVISWPEFALWVPVAMCAAVFTLCGLSKLVCMPSGLRQPDVRS